MANSPYKSSPAGQIAQALVDFSVNGAFPDEAVVTLPVDSNVFPTAIEALANAKANLQVASRPSSSSLTPGRDAEPCL